MTEIIDWKLQGSYFETCNCETACPCVWLQEPSEGDCKLLVAWHIETGYFAKQTLDNLNMASWVPLIWGLFMGLLAWAVVGHKC